MADKNEFKEFFTSKNRVVIIEWQEKGLIRVNLALQEIPVWEIIAALKSVACKLEKGYNIKCVRKKNKMEVKNG